MKLVLAQAFAIWLFASSLAYGFQSVDPHPPKQALPPGHYIVIAAYKSHQENLARRYSEKLEQNKISTSIGFDASRNLYYVYLNVFEEFTQSVREMEKTRESTLFTDAWVRVLKDNYTNNDLPVQAVKSKVVASTNDESQKNRAEKASGANETKKEITTVTPTQVEKVVSASSESLQMISSVETEVIPNPIPAPVYYPQTLRSTPAFLSIHNPRNGRVIDTDVEVVDTDMNRLITKVKGNSYVQLPDPKNKSGKLTLIANPFGYRKVQNVISFRNTEADTLLPHVDMIGNFYLIKFDMVRYHPGDIVTLYNVYFFNDAAIMLPESRYELTTLLEMLTENPGYRIKLHGHTNGNSRGRIISMGPSKEFFKITTDAIESVGSAKELSAARATVIKDWLVANGIADSRIEIKAWGGDRMIHDRNGTHARRNVRVEVEVLEE